MKISLIVPLLNEENLLQQGLLELESFIQKLPLQWELILVIDPGQDNTLTIAQNLKSEKIELKIIANNKHLGRAASIRKAFDHASGDAFIVIPLDFSVPLAELFQFLQEFLAVEGVDLIWGNRNFSRKKMEAPLRTSWHWTLDKISVEKWRRYDQAIADPLCGYFLISSRCFRQLKPELNLHRWYYGLDILPLALNKNLNIKQIAIKSRDLRPSKIPLLKEYFHSLLFYR